jgi:glycosyltransferase involved in cell wall biosynthesis
MAIGKPIVQFDLTEGRRSAQGASLYAEGSDAKDFGDKVLQLLDDPELAKELGEAGRRQVREELSWQQEEKKLVALYAKVLPNRALGRRRLRICMLGYAFYQTDNRIRRYAEALVKRGDDVDAIVLAREGQPRFDVICGVKVCRIQKRLINETGQLSYLLRLMMFLVLSTWTLTIKHLRKPYDVIHVHSVPDFEVLATIIPRLMGARVILDIHDLVPELYASKFREEDRSVAYKLLLALEWLSCAYSNHVIISNDLWYEKIIGRSVKAEKCTSIINYPDPSIFWPRPRGAEVSDDFVMCYPGTLNSHQGVDLAIEAVSLLRDRAPNLKLLIVGDGQDRKKLEQLVKTLGVEDRVTISGFVPMEKIAELMSTIDLGVVPKRKDSFGNEAFSTKIMEFLAMKVPVIASRTRIDEYYFTDHVVEFFESGNVDDLAAKIYELMQSPERRAELCRNGSEFITHNNWAIKGPEYLKMVDRLSA